MILNNSAFDDKYPVYIVIWFEIYFKKSFAKK